MGVRVGVAYEEPVLGGTHREGLLTQFGNRAGQDVVLEGARAVELGEEPVAAGRAYPIGGGERRQWAGRRNRGLGSTSFGLQHKRDHQLGDKMTSRPVDPGVFG